MKVVDAPGGWIEQARVARRRGLLAESRAAFAAAAAAADRAGDTDALVAAALGLGGLWVYEHRDVVDRARVSVLWDRAKALLPPGSLAGDRLAARLAAEAVYEGGLLGAVEAAVARVRSHGDDAGIAEALSLWHHCLLDGDFAVERLGVAEEIIRRAALLDDPTPALMGLCWRTVDLYLLGDLRARQSRVELEERSAGCEAVAFVADLLGAMEQARAGALDAAEAKAAAAFERGMAAGDPDAPAYFVAMIGALRWWQGRAAEVLEPVRAEASSPRVAGNRFVYDAADALLSALAGDPDASAEAVDRAAAVPLDELPRSSVRLTGLFLLGEVAYLGRDERLAAAVAREMAPHAARPVMPSLAVVCFGSAARTAGLAAAAAGDLDAAAAHLEAALAADRRWGSRPMAALTRRDLAAVLRARAAGGDDAAAAALERNAAASAAAMGMALGAAPPWLEPRHPPAGPCRPTSASAPSAPSVCGAVPGPTLRRVAGGWVLGVDGRSARLPDLVGLQHLALLLAAPGTDIDVLTLATGGPGWPSAGEDPVLDATARRQYLARARELSARLHEPVTGADREAVSAELEALRRSLRDGTALGGRPRSFPSDLERARTSVRKALLRAIAAIHAVEPDTGDRLRRAIRTGVTCRLDLTA